MGKDLSKNFILYSLGMFAAYEGLKFLGRIMFKDVAVDAVKTLMTDLYDENLWEFISATTKYTPQIVVETNLRAQEGKTIQRPLGSPRKFPSLDSLMFDICQLYTMPTPLAQPVDTKVIIGKKCSKPLILDIPILIGGMAYGGALSEKAKVALAKGATMAGTATNTGEGPFLKSERKAAKKLILQYNRGTWSKTDEILKQADAIEIQLGQGAIAGVGHKLDSKKIDARLRKQYGLLPGQDAVADSRQREVHHPSQLPRLIKRLKATAGDIPVGIKMGAGKHLEKDIEIAVRSGVDFIAIDGAEAATKASAPLLQDDFGVPTVFAVSRAGDYLKKKGLKDRVSLIASGKIRAPGDILKVLALGADAAYVGSAALFALSHTQVLNALPLEPPTQVVWYDGKYADKFNEAMGANNLAKFLKSCNEELIEGIKALGKTAISQLSKDDLFSLDEVVSKGVGVPMVYMTNH